MAPNEHVITKKRPNKLVPRARQLRRDSTDIERKMWTLLRGRQLDDYKFRRRFPIGRYVADFACFAERLVIEVDGGLHADNPEDAKRTRFIEAQGFRVIRFWNTDVLANPEGVLTTILEALERRLPRLPSPSRRPSTRAQDGGPLPVPKGEGFVFVTPP